MSDTLSTPAAVRALLEKTFAMSVGELGDDTPLFSSGRLDSFHLVELITVLEKTTSRRIAASQVNLGNFDSPRRIAALMAGGAA